MTPSLKNAVNRVHIDWRRRLFAHALAIPLWIAALVSRTASNARVVVIAEPFGMGDIIHLIPVIRLLKSGGYQVILIAQARWGQLIENEGVELWPVPTSWDRLFRWPLGDLIGLIRRFRKQYFSQLKVTGAIGFDSRGDIRSILFLRLLGISHVFSLDHYAGTDLKLLKVATQLVDPSCNQFRWQVNYDLGLAVLGKSESLDRRPPELNHWGPLPEPLKNCIGILPVAPWEGKRWPKENWSELIIRLRDYDPTISFLILCGPGQADYARASLGRVGFPLPIEEAGDIRGLAASIAKCELILSLDSGPMHLAAALGRPVVGLFGCTQLPLWAPASESSRVVTSQGGFSSGPLHQIPANLEAGRQMMAAICVDQVLDACRSLIDEVRSK